MTQPPGGPPTTPANQAAAKPTDPATCCGERHLATAGEPLKLWCQLCPNSPTYWRRGDAA